MRYEKELHVPADGRQSGAAAAIQRGVGRFLWANGMTHLTEFTLPSGRRADVIALGDKSDIWIVEIKSSVADYRSDNKWPDYAAHCDQFYFATSPDVDQTIFPDYVGLIIADDFGATVIRTSSVDRIAPSTRKKLVADFARTAARRLCRICDPNIDVSSVV